MGLDKTTLTLQDDELDGTERLADVLPRQMRKTELRSSGSILAVEFGCAPLLKDAKRNLESGARFLPKGQVGRNVDRSN